MMTPDEAKTFLNRHVNCEHIFVDTKTYNDNGIAQMVCVKCCFVKYENFAHQVSPRGNTMTAREMALNALKPFAYCGGSPYEDAVITAVENAILEALSLKDGVVKGTDDEKSRDDQRRK